MTVLARPTRLVFLVQRVPDGFDWLMIAARVDRSPPRETLPRALFDGRVGAPPAHRDLVPLPLMWLQESWRLSCATPV